MTNHNQIKLRSRLDALAQPSASDDAAIWFARDLMAPLGFARRENFMPAIRRTAASCKTAGQDSSTHFHGVIRMIPDAKGVSRPVTDFKLSRHACHLLAMNGDPRRQPIAFARDYFAPRIHQVKPVEKPTPAPAASAPVTGEPTSPSAAPGSDAGGKKTPAWGPPIRSQGNGGSQSNSRFIPHSGGHQSQGKWNQNRNSAWNQNLAVGRGHPNGGARTSK